MALGRRGSRRERLRISSPENVPESSNALTASGQRLRRGEGEQLRIGSAWQARAFMYYDILGEIKYAAQFYARGLSPLRLYAAEKDANGDLVETTNPNAIAALERVQDPGGGRTVMLAAYGRLMFLTGEALLFVSTDEETEMEQWEMLSKDELRRDGNVYTRMMAPSLPPEQYRDPGDDQWVPVSDDEATAYRLWQRHPRFSQQADSTMQGVLDLCEELVLLTKAVRSRTRSRLAGAGLLFIDDRISPAPPAPEGDEDPAVDIFLSDLTKAMTAPIADEGSASAVVPLIVRVPVPPDQTLSVRDMVSHLQIVDPTQLYPETGLRYECIKRIAIGLDMPPEILMGLGESNHWSAWQIDEQTWKGHLQPKAQQFVDDLTSSYFRPALKDEGLADWQKYSVAYDASAIINHPDRAKDAKDLHKELAISDEALRDATGFKEADAPEREELVRRIGVKVNDGSLATTGVPRAVDSPTGATPPDGTDAPTAAETIAGPPLSPDETEPQDPPVTAAALNGNGNGHHPEATIARILGAADLSVLRCREVAGNRLRSLAKREPSMLALIEGVPSGKIAATLGRERVRALKAPSDGVLVAGAKELILDALRIYDIGGDAVAEKIAENISAHAAQTLYEMTAPGLPTPFTNYVEGLTRK